MNNCTFTGYLYGDPEVEVDRDTGAEYCEFTLYIYEYFRNKRGEKKNANQKWNKYSLDSIPTQMSHPLPLTD